MRWRTFYIWNSRKLRKYLISFTKNIRILLTRFYLLKHKNYEAELFSKKNVRVKFLLKLFWIYKYNNNIKTDEEAYWDETEETELKPLTRNTGLEIKIIVKNQVNIIPKTIDFYSDLLKILEIKVRYSTPTKLNRRVVSEQSWKICSG